MFMKALTRWLEMPLAKRQSHLASSRAPMGKEEFIANIAATETGKYAAALLWKKLQSEKIVAAFSPYPDDDLLKIYGLAEEDLDEDIILEIIRQTGVPTPDAALLKTLGPVNTPADIVRLIEFCEMRRKISQ